MGRQNKRKDARGLNGVVERIRPYAETAQAKTGPVIIQARERLGPVVDDAQKRVVAVVDTAVTASEPYRKEARRRGSAAWLALRGGKPEPPRWRRWTRRLLVVGGVAGGSYAAYRIYRYSNDRQWEPVEATEPISDSGEIDHDGPATSERPSADKSGSQRPSPESGKTGKAGRAAPDVHAGKSTTSAEASESPEPAGVGAKASKNSDGRGPSNGAKPTT